MRNWKEKFDSNHIRVGILGLGYVGLPLAREFARAGVTVLGFDIDSHKVSVLNKGRSIIKNVPHQQVRDMVSGGAFTATADMARLKEVDAILICVPTPLTENREPDTARATHLPGEYHLSRHHSRSDGTHFRGLRTQSRKGFLFGL